MMELFRNAWMGWMELISGGKLTALFLAALIYLWLSGKWKAHKTLYFYAAPITLCCILPLTAAVLMLYQTRFYDYVWLWSLVPVTAVIAWAAVEVVDHLMKADMYTLKTDMHTLKADMHTSKWKRWFPMTVLLLVTLVLSSGTVTNVFDPAKESQERQQAWEVLKSLGKLQDGEICLWAPREILAYAREFDGSVRMLYGRNMWDRSLDAYTYDTYPDEVRKLYLWMENMDPDGVVETRDEEQRNIVLGGVDCVTAALEAGVNCILLPDHIEPRIVREIAKTVDVELSQVGRFYLLTR